MKKLLTSLLCLVLLCGCSSWSNRADSVKSLELSIVDQDYYKNEQIKINIKTNCRYTLLPSDFVMFGGSVEVQDAQTAIVTFPSAGTFHVYANVNGIKSNEITIKVVSENATAMRAPNEDEPEVEIVRNPPEIPYTEKDFMDVETLYYADSTELANSTHVAEHIMDYVGYMFAMEGTIEYDRNYLISITGRHIPLINGYEISIFGPIRVYGIMEEKGFHVKSYSYGR